jgi:hypothetical protein
MFGYEYHVVNIFILSNTNNLDLMNNKLKSFLILKNDKN